MSHIHLVRLTGGKYYVGRSTRSAPEYLLKHLNGRINEWTIDNPPLQVISSIPSTDYSDLDLYVLEYMLLYGMDNVRGGSYTNTHMEYLDYNFIRSELWKGDNLCGRCGREDHEDVDCNELTNVDGEEIVDNEFTGPEIDPYYSDSYCSDSSEINDGYDSYG
jgi:hypothetical protein